ncbi:winged helix-turn-helix transcriptional regulator [Nocardia carnea]|uniref:Winged helix-turn-helix transcriptional regulator n=1 Tax=Nocardia carnea TaxID=37328 RepID=A0ABW7TPB5_9NOCA|nr:helix-turn-helix domain-containing protein [Nocardia carnea]
MFPTPAQVPSFAAAELPATVPSADYEACPVTDIVRILGDKWTLLVIARLARRPYHYNELHRSIEDVSRRMLTRTLRILEADGLVDRTAYPTAPPTVRYSLTPLGETLLDPLSAIAGWAVDHAGDIAAARLAHSGTAAETTEETPDAQVRELSHRFADRHRTLIDRLAD